MKPKRSVSGNLGRTQYRDADKPGKPKSYISKIEAGQRRRDITQIKEFAKIYKKGISFFHKVIYGKAYHSQ